MREKILITGPGGRVGKYLVPLLRKEFQLRLLDLKPLPALDDDEVVQADFRDLAALRQACEGVSVMLHLAAISDEDDFHSKLLPVNLAGVYDAFETARLAGVRKIIFTSTAQTVLHNPPGTMITVEMPPRPWTVYACTKVFGETLARYYSDHFKMSMICIRLAWFQNYDSPELHKHPEIRPHWCSPRDLAQLLTRCIRADLRFAIFFGVSNNPGRFFDVANSRELVGYEPQDNVADYV